MPIARIALARREPGTNGFPRDTLVDAPLESGVGESASPTAIAPATEIGMLGFNTEAPSDRTYGGGEAPTLAPRKTLRVGTCELCFELATGGMATVYLGVHRGAQGFQKLVAVKRLLPAFCNDADYVAMLADEAAVSSDANHACIRDVFDLGMTADGTPYLVMEFLSGEPVSRVYQALVDRQDVLQTGSHHRVAARVIASCCQGIHAAHDLTDREAPRDVVHRDLTPQNLFVLHDGTVRVTDFGIMRARVRRQRPTGQTVLKGKVAYMSPEYLARKPYDRRSDVWALGVVLWELLTGLRLFRRGSEADTFMAVTCAPVPPPSALCGSVDRRLDAIVARAVTRNVDERYATAHAMAEDLEAYLARTGGAVPPSDVSGWLQGLVPDSLPTLTALVNATRNLAAASQPPSDRSPLVAGPAAHGGPLVASVGPISRPPNTTRSEAVTSAAMCTPSGRY